VFQRGPRIDILFADARLADDKGGFTLAQWTRRYRPAVTVILTGSMANKSEAAARLCGQQHSAPPPASNLRARIQAMRANHQRNGAAKGAGRSRASG
jgi:hypothetical protein